MRRRFFILALAVGSAGPIFGETLYLKDGRTLEGKIVAQSPTTVSFSSAGKVMLFNKSQIIRISFFSVDDENKRLARLAEEDRRRRELAERQELSRVKYEFLAQQGRARAARLTHIREQVRQGRMEKPDEPISYWDFAWRSAVLPGWGHFYLQKPVWGFFYAGISAAAVINYAQARGPGISAERDNKEQARLTLAIVILSLNNSSIPREGRMAYVIDQNRKKDAEYGSRVQRYNYALFLLGAVYGTQLTHIAWNGFMWQNGLVVDASADSSSSTGTVHVTPVITPYAALPNERGIQAGFVVQF